MSDNYVGNSPSAAGSTQVILDALAARVAVLEARAPTLGAPTPAVGASIDFAIPVGAKQITIGFAGLSTNGAAGLRIQLASGGIIDGANYAFGGNRAGGAGDLTGVNGAAGGGFDTVVGLAAAATMYGAAILTLLNPATNIWTCMWMLGQSDVPRAGITAGSKGLAGVLDRVRLTTTNGVDLFDGGAFNIMVMG